MVLQKDTTPILVLKRELENDRKELSMMRDQNSKLLEQLKDGNNRELVLKQKSSALNTSNTNLHKDLKDVCSFKYICTYINLYSISDLLIIFSGTTKS